MNYKKINNIVGWAVGLIACLVYMVTKEKSASFWDCGEFLSGSYKLEVVHSPGAPLFLLIGRIFTMFGDKMSAAANVNTLSALASGLSVLFLFWSITHFGKRIMERNGWEIEGGNLVAILGAGVVGGLAYTFCDTAWFSAVEGEVYSLSSFLTAIAFWAILKWEDQTKDSNATNKKFADRWIVMIFFIMGLSIGVHLLNLLAIPAIIMVYYFCRYKVTTRGTVIAGIAGIAGLGLVQKGIIQVIPTLAGTLDRVFVNSFGMPFNSGALFTIVILLAALIFAVNWARKNGKYELHLALVSFLFVIIGYSSYLMIIIRSSADVPIDMTNPDNPLALVKYLQREQYGNTPLLFGPDYNSKPDDVAYSDENYYKGKDRYEPLGKTISEYKYPASEKRFFPRLWDANDPRHIQFYKDYLGLGETDKPSGIDNIKFFINYQCIQMYWRYFMWNFAGRENDTQNLRGEAEGGNWVTGIKFIDKMFGRGDLDKLPVGLRDNRARNEFYALPFILGILGCIYQFSKDKLNAIIVAVLFFFTGFAIVIYLNNTPLQPRERDYAYVGSMYTFAIWIGLGVLFLYDLIKKYIAPMGAATLTSLACLIAVPVIMAKEGWDDHDRSNKTLAPASAKNFLANCDKNAILFTEGDNDTYPLWYLQEIEGYRTDVRVINLSLLGIDWYIDQMNYKINDADKVDMAWNSEDYRGNNLNYIKYSQSPNVPEGTYVDLREVFQFLGKAVKQAAGTEMQLPMPTKLVSLKSKTDSAWQMQWNIGNDAYQKNDLGVLAIVAGCFDKRPIYFSNTIDPKHYEGLYPYLVQEGIIYKLTPKNSGITQVGMPTPVNTAKSYDMFMKTYSYGGAERNDVFFDQTNRRMLNIFRNGASRVADALTEEGKKTEALNLLNHTVKGMTERSYPYSLSDEERTVVYLIMSYVRAGGKKEAEEIFNKLLQYQKDNIVYNGTLNGARKQMHDQDIQSGFQTLMYVPQMLMGVGDSVLAKKFDNQIKEVAGQGTAAPMTPALK